MTRKMLIRKPIKGRKRSCNRSFKPESERWKKSKGR